MKGNIEINAQNSIDFLDKKATVEHLMNLSPTAFKRVSQIVKSPKAEKLLSNYWLMIKAKL